MPPKKDIPDLLIDAALKLATERDWHDVTMIDIATQAGLSVADCYDHCSCKADILRRFVKQVDREVLADLDTEDFNEPGHDRLIAVIMARFDILSRYRPPCGQSSHPVVILARPMDSARSRPISAPCAGCSKQLVFKHPVCMATCALPA